MHNLTPKKQAQGLEIALKSAKTSCLIKDTLYQIIRATHPSIPNPLEQFSYDEVGNRLTDMTHNAYQYNELNQLTEDDSCRYAYDLDGNMTEKIDKATGDTTHFVYDIENKLIEVRKPGMLAKYSYDALGRRMSKEVNGEVRQFRYAGEQLLLEMNENDSIVANYTSVKGIDNPLMMQRDGKKYYYIKDGLGSICALTDTTGSIVHEYKYSAFGEVISESGDSIDNILRYTAREYDKETGLLSYRTRFYDPKIGRFIQEDPIGFAGEDYNLYRYVKNSPENWIDPFGYSGDSYEADPKKHGGPHIDRYDKQGNNVGRYRPDGTGIKFEGKMPPEIPKKDWERFLKAAAKLGKCGALIIGIMLSPSDAAAPGTEGQQCSLPLKDSCPQDLDQLKIEGPERSIADPDASSVAK